MKKLQGAGLRGQSAGQTSLSTVEQEGSLRYLGYSIEDLAKNASFEEVAFLLLLGRLPNKSELDQFENDLYNQRNLPSSLVSVLESIPGPHRLSTPNRARSHRCCRHDSVEASHSFCSLQAFVCW